MENFGLNVDQPCFMSPVCCLFVLYEWGAMQPSIHFTCPLLLPPLPDGNSNVPVDSVYTAQAVLRLRHLVLRVCLLLVRRMGRIGG